MAEKKAMRLNTTSLHADVSVHDEQQYIPVFVKQMPAGPCSSLGKRRVPSPTVCWTGSKAPDHSTGGPTLQIMEKTKQTIQLVTSASCQVLPIHKMPFPGSNDMHLKSWTAEDIKNGKTGYSTSCS